MSDPESAPASRDSVAVLGAIELHEDDDQRCGTEVIVAETGLDESVVNTVLSNLWQQDRIECLTAGWVGLPPVRFSAVRRVIPGRDRRWGERGRSKVD
jgi:hypothetical protein